MERNYTVAQTSAVLDHPRVLTQGDGRAGPAFTRRAVGSECNLIVRDASDVLDDAVAGVARVRPAALPPPGQTLRPTLDLLKKKQIGHQSPQQ
jgi:hypothetical protein